MKGFFFKSVGVPGGSPELGKGNPGWIPSMCQTTINPSFAFLIPISLLIVIVLS